MSDCAAPVVPSRGRVAFLVALVCGLVASAAPVAGADPTTTTTTPSTTTPSTSTVAPTTSLTPADAPATTAAPGSGHAPPPTSERAPTAISPQWFPPDVVPVGPLVDGRDQRGHVLGPSDALAGVPLGADGLAVVATAVDQATSELATRRARLAELERRDAELAASVAELTRHDGELRVARAATSARIQSVTHDLRSIAVARFTSDGPALVSLDAMIRSDHQDDRRVTSTLAAGAIDTSTERLAQLRHDVAALDEEIATGEAALRTAATERDALATDRPRLTQAVADQSGRVDAARSTMSNARSSSNVAGSDMGLVALDAYWRATKAMATTDPDCRLDWWGLAGIGRSESHHGRYKGGVPALDGTVTVPVIGIPLDGSHGTRVIRDTDKGVLDGDTVYDRAVGPMQFIPGTWRRWGADGNGDGRIDPQNFYDMALAAARLLCSGGGGLDTDEGLLAAYLRYNRDPAYMPKVLGWARAYQLLPVPSVLSAPPTP